MKRSPDAASEGVCDSAYAGLRGPRPASSLTVPSPCRYDYCVAPEDPEVVPSFWQRGGPFLVARDNWGDDRAVNVQSSEPARLVSTLSGYGLSWIDVQPDLRELRLQFIAGVKEPR